MFLCPATDGHRYWIKPTGKVGGLVEQVVGRAGHLIGAPVPAVRVVSVPEKVASETGVRSGLVHGSRNVGEAETHGDRARGFRHYDGQNAARVVAGVALWDWCWGGGGFEYLRTTDGTIVTVDHGGWFPPAGGARVHVSALEENADAPRPLPCNPSRVPDSDVSRVATTLRNVTREDLVRHVLRPVPTSWRVDRRLEAIGAFLEHRAPAVADRLEDRLL